MHLRLQGCAAACARRCRPCALAHLGFAGPRLFLQATRWASATLAPTGGNSATVSRHRSATSTPVPRIAAREEDERIMPVLSVRSGLHAPGVDALPVRARRPAPDGDSKHSALEHRDYPLDIARVLEISQGQVPQETRNGQRALTVVAGDVSGIEVPVIIGLIPSEDGC